MSAQPATKVLAQVYQLYIVEYHFASMLISQSQGMVDMTVSANTTKNRAAQTVFVQVKLFASSRLKDVLSMLRERRRTLEPIKYHSDTVSNVQTVKNPLFKNGDLVCSS